ncbi:hypothetical protein [Cryobacterium zhongshanensis]|uniref:Uncharacterized protein n=1 Tax=Cryobacterium zhongshanensis TaxID=2928153 RepID=A0AA41UII1_9MICO|nr:hypothetical protein [Cryobacterium zhongshanensis]MCI4659544.1 hypothetical protein [Cryobacterium zhongshanensis]
MPITGSSTPEVTPATAELIADLNLLPKHFTETGIIERLVAQLIEKDLALTVARAELAGRGEVFVETQSIGDGVSPQLDAITTQLAAWLAARGWTVETGGDRVAFNKLVLKLVDTNTFIDSFDSVDEIIDAFIAANPPRA